MKNVSLARRPTLGIIHMPMQYLNDRFSICGAISQYNKTKSQGPRNFSNVIAQRIKIQGFIIFDYASRYGEAQTALAKWLSAGKLKRHVTIIGGLENAEQGLLGLFEGINLGKLLIKVANEKCKL